MSDEKRKIICVDPWPANPIEEYTTVNSGPWGYLTMYNDGTFEFSEERRPTRQEIISLWLSRFPNEEE